MKVLIVGDVVGNPGRKAVKKFIPEIKKTSGFDFCVANGENAAGGVGITNAVAHELFDCGVDVITLGNHTWSKREVMMFLDEDKRIIRPANFHPDLPGNGSTVIEGDNKTLGIINIQGRTFMDNIDCPFKAILKEIEYLKGYTSCIIVDFHAEATSEKVAMGWHADGKVSCVIGTHTHVQTADERILPAGTAYISDIGMTGPRDGIIGMEREIVLERFIKNLPSKFFVAGGPVQFNSVLTEINESTGRALSIERINFICENL